MPILTDAPATLFSHAAAEALVRRLQAGDDWLYRLHTRDAHEDRYAIGVYEVLPPSTDRTSNHGNIILIGWL